MEKYNFVKVQQQVNKIFKEKKCLHPDNLNCSGGIIRSHTIQKNGALRNIEGPEGHVWGFVQNKKFDESGPFIVDKVSINEASTFNGFCGKHDNKLFHCVDDYDFEPTDEQVFMLTYRTVVRELYTKTASVKSNPHIDTIIKEIPDLLSRKILEDEVAAMNEGSVRGKEYATEVVADMFHRLRRNDFSEIRYFLIKTKDLPKVVTSGAFMPDFDYDDKKINDYKKDEVYWIALNIFSDSKNGLILFSWLDNEKSEQFIKSLLYQEDIPNKAIEIAFTNIENTYFSKKWWDSLKVIHQSRIKKMMENWIHYNLETGKYTGIRRNNLHYVSFDIISQTDNFHIKKMNKT